MLIAVTDGLKGMSEALAAIYPAITLRTCIVHLLRHSLDLATCGQVIPFCFPPCDPARDLPDQRKGFGSFTVCRVIQMDYVGREQQPSVFLVQPPWNLSVLCGHPQKPPCTLCLCGNPKKRPSALCLCGSIPSWLRGKKLTGCASVR